MKKLVLPVTLLFVAVLFSCDRNAGKTTAPGAPPEKRNVLNVPLIKQQTDQWCWAASAEMVMTYHRKPYSQCVQASYKFPDQNCCKFPTPPKCIRPGWPDYGHFDFHFYTTHMGQALSWEALKKEIDQNRPISFSWGWKGGGGHMMDAIGYIENNNEKLVAIHDPWKPSSVVIPYHEFVSSNRYDHWADYYEIHKK